MSTGLEDTLKSAQASDREHRGDVDSIEAVLDRLKAGFGGNMTAGGEMMSHLTNKVAAMKQHSLPSA